MVTAIKYLPLVYVALSNNMGPLFTAILSFLCIGEKLKRIDIAVLIISFLGILLMILNTPERDESNSLDETGNPE